MKTKTFLNKKITQWVLLGAILLGCSANAWAADCGSTSVAANTTIYVDASYVSGDFSNVYLSLVTDTNKGKAGSIKNGDVSGMSGYKPSSDTWNFKTKTSKSGNVYTFKITSDKTIYGIAVWAGDLSSYNDIYQTKVSATCEFVAGGTYTIMPDKTYHNDRQSYGYTGTWESFSPCDGYSVPSEVLNGTNIMFYVEGPYDGYAAITNNSTTCLGTREDIENKKSAINIAKTSIPSSAYVTNNCSNWKGDNPITGSNIKAGGYYKYNNDWKDDPKTLTTFSPSSASITEGTASVNITVKGESENSAYAGQNFKLYSIIYVDSDRDGCIPVSTSDQTYTLNTSSLTEGTYTVQSVLTDGHIYYLDESFTLTVTAACTPPTITGHTDGSRCGTGTVTIGATASAGDVKWYDAATSGTFLNSGDSFTTPSISETTTYYAEADNNGCVSTSRTSVTATVNSIPTITANDNSRCGAGDITLTATPSSGASVDWYDSSTGDNKVAENTTSLTVQGVTVGSPVTRYAEAVKNGCKSSSRAQAVATAKLIPAVSNIALTGSGECGTGDVTFTATATENSTITWYDGGSSKGTDNPITISIAGGSSKTLTAKATLDGCEESTGMSEEGSRKAAPAISASTTNTTAYEVITLTSTSGSVLWSKDAADTKAYFVKDQKAVDEDTVEGESVNFKAPAKNTDYTVTAEGSNGCTSNLNITIGEPQEVCN